MTNPEVAHQDAVHHADAERPEFSHSWRFVSAFWVLVVPSCAFAVLFVNFEATIADHPTLYALMADLRTLEWFAIPVVASIAVTVAALLFPRLPTIPLVRLGLQCALAFAISYALAVLFGTHGLGLAPIAVFALVATIGHFGLRRWDGAREVASVWGIAAYAFIVFIHLTASAEPPYLLSVAMIITMLSGPAVSAWIIGQLLAATSAPRASAPSYVAAGAVALATWQQAISQSLEVYNELPPSSDCYVATAAASGHPRFVGSAPNSIGMSVNGQLRTFKAGEIVIRETTPRLHRGLRIVYDRVGPPAADRVRANRWLADLTFVALLPFQLVTRLVLTLALRSERRARVARLYT